MKDRTPLYPGRIRLVPVEGQQYLYDMTRADGPTQSGTPLNKATFLKDDTASLFGMGNYAVPDDVLAYLGRYNQHWWSVINGQETTRYIEKQIDNTVLVEMNNGTSRDIQYSHEVSIDQSTGAVSLMNPQIFNIPMTKNNSTFLTAMQGLLDLAPVYISNLYDNASTVYFLPSGTNIESSSGSATGTIIHSFYGDYKSARLNNSATNPAKIVTSELIVIPAGEISYDYSTNRNAFPDSGTVDGLTYEYLGIPFDNAVNAVKVEKGIYIGTGTYGSSNQNSLTFEFTPKIVLIQPNSNDYSYQSPYIVGSSYMHVINGSSSVYNYVSVSDKTMSWYCEGNSNVHAKMQLNSAGVVYSYIAIR